MSESTIERVAGESYESIYRRMNPRQFPYSAFERQAELRDLWPSEQAKFRRMIDTILKGEGR